MRRYRAFSALLAAMATLLYGCGDSSEEAASPPSTAPAGSSHLARLEITSRVSPAFTGKTFGSAGAYEVLIGKLRGEADPNSPRNADVTDLKGAQRNAAGRVEYSADVVILKPIDMSKSDGTLTYEVTNRGNTLAPRVLWNGSGDYSSAAGADAAQGVGLTQGHVFVWSGWQGDISSTLTASGSGSIAANLPVAKKADGTAITGTVIDEIVLDGSAASMIPAIPTTSTSFAVPLSYTPVQADTTKINLTVQQHADDVPVVLPASQMAFIGPKTLRVQLAAGYDLGAVYHATYVAKDPIVAALGAVSIRDLVSFLRYADKDDAGVPNPMAVNGRSAVQRTIAIGFSQSGRFLRDFIYHDFNIDEQGRKAFDGMLPAIAGAKRAFATERFAQLAALVLRPRLHLIRFHGVLAPNAKLRPLVVPMGPPAPRQAIAAEDGPFEATPEPERRNHIPWAKLLARVFKLDLEHCPNCGGGLRMVAAILEREAIERILGHLKLPS